MLGGIAHAAHFTLLNVSYDPTRELWRDINANFVRLYEKEAMAHRSRAASLRKTSQSAAASRAPSVPPRQAAGRLELNPEPVNLARLIDEVVGTAGQLAERNQNRLVVGV